MRALREASPQARRHFTRFDQVEQLVRASEADPDRGFMARLMMLCSLPRANPGRRLQYKRVNRCGPKAASCSWGPRSPGSWASWTWLPSAEEDEASAREFTTT